MGTMTTSSPLPLHQDPGTYDEVSMENNMFLSDNLKDLKNLRKQLYSAAEYFQLSYTHTDQRQIVTDTLKDYVIKAFVSTVDHLGSVTYKVNDLLEERVDEVSRAELQASCIEQRLQTCQIYIDHESLSQQSLLINTPKYHKKYILQVGETKPCANDTKSMYKECNLGDEHDQPPCRNEMDTGAPHHHLLDLLCTLEIIYLLALFRKRKQKKKSERLHHIYFPLYVLDLYLIGQLLQKNHGHQPQLQIGHQPQLRAGQQPQMLLMESIPQSFKDQCQGSSMHKDKTPRKLNITPARVNVYSRPCSEEGSPRTMTCYILTWMNTNEKGVHWKWQL